MWDVTVEPEGRRCFLLNRRSLVGVWHTHVHTHTYIYIYRRENKVGSTFSMMLVLQQLKKKTKNNLA